MVGGVVQRVYQFEDRRSVVVRGTGVEAADALVVDVPLEGHRVEVGDTIWWQNGQLMLIQREAWRDPTVQIDRIGNAYSQCSLWPRVAELCREGVCPDCNQTSTMFNGKGGLWCPRCGASYNLEGVA